MTSDRFTERERMAILWAEHVTLNTAKEDNGVFERVRAVFSEEEIIELTLMSGFFNLFNRLTDSLHELEPTRMSGGSAANTLIAVQAFGASTFYSCKVADDDTGRHFLGDLREAGVVTNRNAADGQGKSGRCLVLITPDAERSMNTFLGISSHRTRTELDEQALAGSRYFYAEGYMSSAEGSRDAAIFARNVAEDAGVKTVRSLADIGSGLAEITGW